MERSHEESYASRRCHANALKYRFRVWVKGSTAEGMDGVHAFVNGLAANAHVMDCIAKLLDRNEIDKQMNLYNFQWIAVTKDDKAPFGTYTAKAEHARHYLRTWKTYENWLKDPRVTIKAKNRKRLTTEYLHDLYYELNDE